MYLVELQQSKILQFMGVFIGVILFIAVFSFYISDYIQMRWKIM